MSISKFSFKRSITSYAKVQNIIATVTRCRPQFIKRGRIRDLKLLNVGCGPNTDKNFINLDYGWVPGIDICWDITRKQYPLSSGTLEGIYTEHCLEHISFNAFKENMKEFYRLLVPGGNLRIIMPDGELYLDIYERRKRGEQIAMPHEKGYITPMARINGIFRNHGHQFIYDFATVKAILQEVGFKDIKKETYQKGRDSRLLIDSEWRADESLYVEATK